MSNIALFLDLDNFTIGAKHANTSFDIDMLLDYLEESLKGRVVLRRAYGDTRQNNKLLRQLATAGFIIQAAIDVSGYGKNLADMQIVVDAMETLLANNPYDTYVLITGDRDFTPVVQCLRQHGKKVIGIGIKHTASYSLANLCDSYLYYKDIAFFGQQPDISVRDLLVHALEDLFVPDTIRVQASLVRQRMNDLTNNRFDHTLHTDGNFTQFLKDFPELIETYHEDTTTYVCLPSAAPKEPMLYAMYRTGLKKLRLRVVIPSDLRIAIIKDMVKVLQEAEEMQWRELLETLFLHCNQKGMDASKNAINDVLLLSRKAHVIRTAKGATLATAPVKLELNSERMLRDSVIHCDIVYLQAIRSLDEPFDIEEASLALYDSKSYSDYLKAILPKNGE